MREHSALAKPKRPNLQNQWNRAVLVLHLFMVILRNLLSRLESERTESGNTTNSNAAAVEIIKTAIMTSRLRLWLTRGMPKIVASVFGIAMTNVTQVRVSMTHVRPARRLFSLSFEAVK